MVGINSVLSLLCSGCFLLLTTFVRPVYEGAMTDLAIARLELQASREACPQVQHSKLCVWDIYAKTYSGWMLCDNDKPPTGADLPSHRRFLIKPRCKMPFGFPVFLADQVALR